eukprot:TRINITY_DN2016_c0_g1_i1.p1 TRINITY_DN2016_c0_g1~~TRINITY_DN2016_c0_g1_i1.p1  ORF type:complete len:99 (-),score=9.29 TRINITY_DN2016_c0_g1_i1:42-338(-)
MLVLGFLGDFSYFLNSLFLLSGEYDFPMCRGYQSLRQVLVVGRIEEVVIREGSGANCSDPPMLAYFYKRYRLALCEFPIVLKSHWFSAASFQGSPGVS